MFDWNYLIFFGKIYYIINYERVLKNKTNSLVSFIKVSQVHCSDFKSTKIVFYFGPTLSHHQNYDLDDSTNILQHDKFNWNRTTLLYLHGYKERQNVESIETIVHAYYKRNDHNILVLDWSQLANERYIDAAFIIIEQLGAKLAYTLNDMFDSGFKIENFHLIGHSLGGQLAGVIGRKLIEYTNSTQILKRLTALDPAFPGFYNVMYTQSVSENDANFVDIIHTDAGFYGSPFSLGTVDFWPNGGISPQPGCEPRNFIPLSDIDLCSHRRSWRYWAESVIGNNFLSFRARNWNAFVKMEHHLNSLNSTFIISMGIDCPLNAYGNYYLRTNSQKPFA